jgi:transcriptional regulator with XRE-family HTH domain
MTGKELKDIILSEKMTVAEVARRIGTTQQNLTCSLSKDDIRTGLLERVAAAMGKPLAFFYGEAFGAVQNVTGNNNTQVSGNSNTITSDAAMLALLKMKDEQLTMAMNQTSKAQEQMDRVLDRLEGRCVL